jgi:hypothetical protein
MSKSAARQKGKGPRVLRLPWLDAEETGLGTLTKRLTTRLGIAPCAPCQARADALDRRLVIGGGRRRRSMMASGDCWKFSGRCTGFGSRQCVLGPARQEPDAEIITQCCGGWFQYPWIEVCPGQEARAGCGFCFW